MLLDVVRQIDNPPTGIHHTDNRSTTHAGIRTNILCSRLGTIPNIPILGPYIASTTYQVRWARFARHTWHVSDEDKENQEDQHLVWRSILSNTNLQMQSLVDRPSLTSTHRRCLARLEPDMAVA